ncbi:multidrug efflux pump subunit AcrA (membrane-fusion protein) [Saonia flava]|uniref:Multidrug efflux pump subunit AcrA (Membrane-fusion protein) n=1 Tax=Saonia flava TaxID=523696 RepID=A0A846R2L2_9FLAO|nr:HlyD family efflux transporter periplasmic adaptor subunit [Saonia flava]NJB72185.1 multidrug efflux pump subunit AcrA (membrane-fusion protein) [Saonia flava]
MSKIYAVLLLGLLISCGTKQEKIKPEIKSITQSIYASATVQPDSLYLAYAAVNGILDANLVEEGDNVEKGTPILQIINTSPKLSTENAKVNVQLARDNYKGSSALLNDLQDQIKAATLTLSNDSINFFRQKNLWEQKIGSQIEYDNRKLAYELSKNNLKLLNSNYDRTQRELAAQLKQAQNNYKSSQILTKDFTVVSKINGKVYALFKNPGEIATTMEPLASIGSKNVFVLDMLVDEVDVIKIKVGQKAMVTLDAYNSRVFETKINKIYPRKDERSQTFKVEAIFIAPPEVLYPGLSGEANIIIAQKENILTIPKEYLIGENKVLTENGEVEIDLGLENLDHIEVLKGLDSETYILKPDQ